MNRIVIELCEEDRARIDHLTAAVERLATKEAPITDPSLDELNRKIADTMAAVVNPNNPVQKKTDEGDTPPWEDDAPTITQDQLQQKVTYLVAYEDGKFKADVKKIVNLYSATVSGIPEDKYAECWAKLTELEVNLK